MEVSRDAEAESSYESGSDAGEQKTAPTFLDMCTSYRQVPPFEDESETGRLELRVSSHVISATACKIVELAKARFRNRMRARLCPICAASLLVL